MKILYADDEIKYQKLVSLFLKNQGYDVYTTSNGEEMITLFSKHPDADLIILDVMMPIMDGLETCTYIRESSQVPILMLTALGDIKSEVNALNLGADDYISKPFTNEKLVARVAAILRRNKMNEETYLQVDGLAFNETNYHIEFDRTSFALTQKEYHLLKILVIHKNQVLTRDSILDKVWGIAYQGDPRTLDTHIKSLRSKIGQASSRIQTVRGKGYYYRSES